jgi:hypothetical protein
MNVTYGAKTITIAALGATLTGPYDASTRLFTATGTAPLGNGTPGALTMRGQVRSDGSITGTYETSVAGSGQGCSFPFTASDGSTAPTASTTAPATGGPSESVTVPANGSGPVTGQTALLATHRYQISASGTASYWCSRNDPTSCSFPGMPHPSVELAGTDALWCYATWRCPTPQLWRPLLVNGMGLDQLAGNPNGVAYDPSHDYSVQVTGISGPLTFTSQAGSFGGFSVTVTDLG